MCHVLIALRARLVHYLLFVLYRYTDRPTLCVCIAFILVYANADSLKHVLLNYSSKHYCVLMGVSLLEKSDWFSVYTS